MGEEVDALVLTKEDQDGRLIMSKKRARFEKAWRRIEAAAESGEPVEGTVIEVVKGGLIIDLGVRGFLPASLVDIRRVPNLDEYMGTKIESQGHRAQPLAQQRRPLAAARCSRRSARSSARRSSTACSPGLIVEGQISNIVDFGAFVDLNGIDGLIHISELSWSHVNHPSEILSIGDTVQVKVLDIDRDRQRISLGLKQTQEDPWQRVVDTYNVGDELEGTVTKVVTFGAFVEILDGVEGLVHISELANHHVENPREVVQPGDDVRVKILEIDSERRRLSLSVKRVEGQVLPRRDDRGAEGAGDLDDVPELGLSEDVFADAAPEPPSPTRHGRRRAGRRADEPRRPPADGRPPPRRRGRRRAEAPRPRSRRRRGAEAEPPPSEPAADDAADEPGGRGRRRRRSSCAEPRRLPFVGLTGGLGAGKSTALAALERPRRGDALDRRRRARALRRPPRCATRSSARWGDGRRARRRRSTAPRSRGPRSPTPRRARVARGAALAAGRRARRGVARGGRAAPSRRRAPPSSRRRCCSRPAWRASTTRRSRSSPTRTCAPSAPPRAGTTPSTSARPASYRRTRRRPARRTWSQTADASRSSSLRCPPSLRS